MNRLLDWLLDVSTDRQPRQVVGPSLPVIGPAPQVIGPRPSTTVEAPARFAWDEKRWTRTVSSDAVEVRGHYRAYDRRLGRWREFPGYLIERDGDIAAYIDNPPGEVKKHRHGACLQLVDGSWFRLHWRRQPNNLDAALLYVERLLDESINQH